MGGIGPTPPLSLIPSDVTALDMRVPINIAVRDTHIRLFVPTIDLFHSARLLKTSSRQRSPSIQEVGRHIFHSSPISTCRLSSAAGPRSCARTPAPVRSAGALRKLDMATGPHACPSILTAFLSLGALRRGAIRLLQATWIFRRMSVVPYLIVSARDSRARYTLAACYGFSCARGLAPLEEARLSKMRRVFRAWARRGATRAPRSIPRAQDGCETCFLGGGERDARRLFHFRDAARWNAVRCNARTAHTRLFPGFLRGAYSVWESGSQHRIDVPRLLDQWRHFRA